ncbi:MAG: GNAT family protein [Nitriliruptoraceae bacterium]
MSEGLHVATDSLVVDAELELRPVTEAITPSLVEAVRESKDTLSPWMAWATPEYGPKDAQFFIELVAAGDERAYVISSRDGGGFHGICSLNRIDQVNRTANLGYWLRSTSTGRGLATRAARRLLVHALEDLGIERVEIATSPANAASVDVGRRLGLAEEGLRSRAIRVGDDQHDARVFVALSSDLEQLRQTPPRAQ